MKQDPSPMEQFDPQRLRGGPMLVVLSGPSGVGKDAVVAHMRQHTCHWRFVVTATTRPQRPGEQHGVDYLFITPERFQEMAQRNEFLEYAQVYGHWYGVPCEQVKDALARGLDVIVKADVQGAATIKQKVPEALCIFLAPPSIEELEERLRRRRTESPQQLAVRIQTARQEMEKLPLFDYAVVNYDGQLTETVANLAAIAAAEKCRIPPRRIRL